MLISFLKNASKNREIEALQEKFPLQDLGVLDMSQLESYYLKKFNHSNQLIPRLIRFKEGFVSFITSPQNGVALL